MEESTVEENKQSNINIDIIMPGVVGYTDETILIRPELLQEQFVNAFDGAPIVLMPDRNSHPNASTIEAFNQDVEKYKVGRVEMTKYDDGFVKGKVVIDDKNIEQEIIEGKLKSISAGFKVMEWVDNINKEKYNGVEYDREWVAISPKSSPNSYIHIVFTEEPNITDAKVYLNSASHKENSNVHYFNSKIYFNSQTMPEEEKKDTEDVKNNSQEEAGGMLEKIFDMLKSLVSKNEVVENNDDEKSDNKEEEVKENNEEDKKEEVKEEENKKENNDDSNPSKITIDGVEYDIEEVKKALSLLKENNKEEEVKENNDGDIKLNSAYNKNINDEWTYAPTRTSKDVNQSREDFIRNTPVI